MDKICIKIKSTKINKTIWTEQGNNLLDVLRQNNIVVTSFCGGGGTCGKCKVIVDGQAVLACKTKVDGNITVQLFDSSEDIISCTLFEQEKIDTKQSSCVVDIGTTTLAVAILANEKVVEITTIQNPQKAFGGDIMSRIKHCSEWGLQALQKCLVQKLNSTIVELVKKYKLPKISKMTVSGNVTMLHIFLGVDCSAIGQAPYKATFLQEMATSADTLGFDFDCVIRTLPSIASFVGSDIVVGIDYVSSIAKRDTAACEDNMLRSIKSGIDVCKNDVSSHVENVGVACEDNMRHTKTEKFDMLIDLGTNAEIAIFNNDRCLCTAAAAGPCFEGANISQGMSATAGAIDSFKIEDGIKKHTTVGTANAIGICGSGLIDIVAQLFKNEIIDENGTFENDKYFEICDNVVVTQKDIREYQLAKSAVRSAVDTLIFKLGISYDNIEKVFLSGGFSTYVNIDNACICGLIPWQLKEKCKSVGNTSLSGAIKASKENVDLSKVINIATYVDLASDSFFTQSFVNNIGFFENN